MPVKAKAKSAVTRDPLPKHGASRIAVVVKTPAPRSRKARVKAETPEFPREIPMPLSVGPFTSTSEARNWLGSLSMDEKSKQKLLVALWESVDKPPVTEIDFVHSRIRINSAGLEVAIKSLDILNLNPILEKAVLNLEGYVSHISNMGNSSVETLTSLEARLQTLVALFKDITQRVKRSRKKTHELVHEALRGYHNAVEAESNEWN